MKLFKDGNIIRSGFIGVRTIYGVDEERNTPYMTRINIGRLYLHIFHRGDADKDPHDHPWDFWTFPLTSYVEEVIPTSVASNARNKIANWPSHDGPYTRVVRAFRLHYRHATHTHRVLGRWAGHLVPGNGEAVWTLGRIVTIVWKSKPKRAWGFLKNRDGKWCWVPWKEYVFHGAKNTPCD